MGGEWASVGDIGAIQPGIGDVWADRRYLAVPDRGRVSICDVIPFNFKPDEAPKPVERVCIEHVDGRREWLMIADLRKRFAFRRKA